MANTPDPWERFSRSIRAQAAKAGFKSLASLHRATGIDEDRLRYMIDHPKSIKMRDLVKLEAGIGIDMEALTCVLRNGGSHG